MEKYANDGYCVFKNCVSSKLCQNLGSDFENKIDSFAQDNDGLSRREYLSVIHKWSHCNSAVMEIMWELSSLLRHKVAEVLDSEVAWPVGAVLIRKSSDLMEASFGETNPHQDISYARFPGSQMFRATTWVPLYLDNGDTLAFAAGSHKNKIDFKDFLQTSPSKVDPPPCMDIIDVSLGDCILFDARVWHKSTKMPYTAGNVADKSLRLAIGIQWLTPGGLDGLTTSGTCFRWPDSDVPEKVPVDQMRIRKVWGMDTAECFLKTACIKLIDMYHSPRATEDHLKCFSTVEIATWFSDLNNSNAVSALKSAGCNASAAQVALQRYVLFRKATKLHYGEAQGTRIFTPLYDNFIKRVLDM